MLRLLVGRVIVLHGVAEIMEDSSKLSFVSFRRGYFGRQRHIDLKT